MIEDHPILGVGFFNFPPYYLEHYPTELYHGHAQLPHNIFIQVGTDTGLLGLWIFVMLIYRNLRAAKDIERACEANRCAPEFAPAVSRGLATATWGFVIAGQFVTVAYYPFLWINLALSVSLVNIVTRATAPDTLETTPSKPGTASGLNPKARSDRSRRIKELAAPSKQG